MAIIYSYPIATPKGSDYITISRIPEDPEEISNYSIDITSLASLINTGQATIIQVDDRVVTGASFNTGTGVLTLTRNGGEIPSVTTNLDGRYYLSSKITATSNYIPKLDATGSLVNSVIYQDGDGHVGIGVPGSPPNPIHKFEVYDDRSENISSDYTQVNSTVVGPPWTGGGGGILSRLSTDAGSTFPYGISLIPGTIASDIASSDKMAFHANSDLDTRAPSGFSGFISHDGANPHWQIGGAVTDPNPTQTLKVVGTGEFTGQVTIPQTPINPTDAASKAYVDAQSGGGGGGVTSIIAGTGISILPGTGLGDVTITNTLAQQSAYDTASFFSGSGGTDSLAFLFNGNASDQRILSQYPDTDKLWVVLDLIAYLDTSGGTYTANGDLYVGPDVATPSESIGIKIPATFLNSTTNKVIGIRCAMDYEVAENDIKGTDLVLKAFSTPVSISSTGATLKISYTRRLLTNLFD
jgi:hypothetical protein